MNARLLKAMLKCCDGKPGDPLAQPTLRGGELLATDRVVAVRYRERAWDPAEMPAMAWQLYAHELDGLRPAEKVGAGPRGFVVRDKACGYPCASYPDLAGMWDGLVENRHHLVADVDPRQLRRVLGVFEAAGANVTVTNRGHLLELDGWGRRGSVEVRALVMGCRR